LGGRSIWTLICPYDSKERSRICVCQCLLSVFWDENSVCETTFSVFVGFERGNLACYTLNCQRTEPGPGSLKFRMIEQLTF
jgi:hypothetical protein